MTDVAAIDPLSRRQTAFGKLAKTPFKRSVKASVGLIERMWGTGRGKLLLGSQLKPLLL